MGVEAETARHLLREYTAAVIAGTWHQEMQISGDDVRQALPPAVVGSIGSPALGDMLSRRIEQDQPFDGIFNVLSQPLHDALPSCANSASSVLGFEPGARGGV
jgi:hypothetical protein